MFKIPIPNNKSPLALENLMEDKEFLKDDKFCEIIGDRFAALFKPGFWHLGFSLDIIEYRKEEIAKILSAHNLVRKGHAVKDAIALLESGYQIGGTYNRRYFFGKKYMVDKKRGCREFFMLCCLPETGVCFYDL